MDAFGLMLVLGRERRLVLGLPVTAAVIALAVAFVIPKTYTAKTLILTPQQGQSSASALLGQLGGLGALAGASGSSLLKNPADLYVAMLKSNNVADALIHRFDLKAYYSEDLLVETRKCLAEDSRFRAEKSGVISIEVDAKDPKLAADMANAFVAELHRVTTTLAVTEAAQRRVFFERQLTEAKEKLAASESNLREAIRTGGVISVDAQSRAAVEMVARLRAQVTAKELQIGSMRAYSSPQNPDLMWAEQELATLRSELAKLESGTQDRAGNAVSPAGAKVSERGLTSIKLLREVKYAEAMFEFLAKQYEVARIDESKQAPLVQVMDQATPPEKKSRPKRLLITAIAFVAGLVVAVTIAVWRIVTNSSARLEQMRELWLVWTGRR